MSTCTGSIINNCDHVHVQSHAQNWLGSPLSISHCSWHWGSFSTNHTMLPLLDIYFWPCRVNVCAVLWTASTMHGSCTVLHFKGHTMAWFLYASFSLAYMTVWYWITKLQEVHVTNWRLKVTLPYIKAVDIHLCSDKNLSSPKFELFQFCTCKYWNWCTLHSVF